jgi:hypothetical protein
MGRRNASHAGTLRAFAKANSISSIGLSKRRPPGLLYAYYISMTGPDSRWIQN